MTDQPQPTEPLDLVPYTPSTLDVLRHIRSNYGYDTKQLPLYLVQRELDALIGTMEQYA